MSSGLVQTTSGRKLYSVVPTKHSQLHLLNLKRLQAPQLVFWNGIGEIGETVFIIAPPEEMQRHSSDFESKGLKLTIKYDVVKIKAIEHHPDHSKDGQTNMNVGKEQNEMTEGDLHPEEAKSMSLQQEVEDIEERLARGEKLDDETEANLLIVKRLNKFDAELTEDTSIVPRTAGLLPVKPIKSATGRMLPLNSGILYRIQGMQTFFQTSLTEPERGEWVVPNMEGVKKGHIPNVGEYVAISQTKKRGGTNPFVTSEEDHQMWKNIEYRESQNSSVLWIFVPTEYDKFYEIRNRNYPDGLLVFNYDVEEGEFVLNLEIRKEYLKRYTPDGVLRARALFSFQLVSENFEWELRHDRPKYYLVTYNSNHVYSYESKKKKCTLLVVRNAGMDPYTSPKSEKFNRALDMFYITRLGLTGQYTANIFSFMYEKSIVDVFAKSAVDGTVTERSNFELANRSPIHSFQYVFDEIPFTNEYHFKFPQSFKEFQWVTVEGHVPSFGVAPLIQTGVLGENTNVQEIKRSVDKVYKIQDKIKLEPGTTVSGSIHFQSIQDFVNPFTAMMEVTEPTDRFYWDKQGRPKFVRLSMPGSFIERTWASKANITYERVIEKREVAMVVQITGTLISTYGLRAFVRKSHSPYSTGIVACEAAR